MVTGAVLCVTAAFAEPALPDAAQEARARVLFHEFRCVVCDSTTIADSPAEVAADMRAAIRTHMAQGATDEEVRAYLVSRYGESILMRPPVPSHLLLWFGPLLLLLLGGLTLRRYFKHPA